MKFSTIKNIVLVALIALFFYQLKGGKLNIGKTTVVDGKKYEIIKEIHDTTEVIKTNIKWKKGSDIDKIKNNTPRRTIEQYFREVAYKENEKNKKFKKNVVCESSIVIKRKRYILILIC